MADLNSTSISADEARRRLVEGNERFMKGGVRVASLRPESLAHLAQSQNPFATILGCSDSRVPPELIFDVGLGELFVVRVAGNVLGAGVAGSLQYAGVHLHTQLFVVLGHEGCGAVIAALKARDEGEQQRSRIRFLIDSIVPALPPFAAELSSKERIAQAVESNVRCTVRQILETPEGQLRQAEGQMKVIGAVYDIESGRVRFLS